MSRGRHRGEMWGQKASEKQRCGKEVEVSFISSSTHSVHGCSSPPPGFCLLISRVLDSISSPGTELPRTSQTEVIYLPFSVPGLRPFFVTFITFVVLAPQLSSWRSVSSVCLWSHLACSLLNRQHLADFRGHSTHPGRIEWVPWEVYALVTSLRQCKFAS